ncbi:MAG: ABC transporter ATP-binding protein/permease [Eubacteriales bacterium]|nr:ABC transporter ATP-binding protein/permease [Eubacteriales bacterium]
MLQLKNIVKTYTVGDTAVPALRGIDLCFRENEFVAILGPSGCGKTTLLNIIGGLDNYSSGDLVINGTSTKQYRDADWDAYRNHSIGFIFQSYNLIPHQTVLSNVELALTLSGVPKSERRRRATAALEAVGLGDQLRKKPNQMSGGQMQRVAVARALVNNPDILLADEPTGALDSETSIQLMEILKDIAKTRLVIMVTHNPELAQRYATRTVRVLDGRVVDDSAPVTESELSEYEKQQKEQKPFKAKKPSMSFFTALSLSLNNLMTKKGRTFLTAFAGSIGIIGIALILSLSNGVQNYINRVQEDTLSSYPITINAKSVDMSSLVSSITGVHNENASVQRTEEELASNVYSSAVIYDLLNALNSAEVNENNLTDFKKYLDTETATGARPLDGLATAVKYSYDIDLNIYAKTDNGDIVKADIAQLIKQMSAVIYGVGTSSSAMDSTASYYANVDGFRVWEEMLSDEQGNGLVNPLLYEQYDMIYGHWPEKYNEVVLVVDKNNSVSDMVLYCLGLLSAEDIANAVKDSAEGKEIETELRSWTFEEICNITLKYIPSAAKYSYNAVTGGYTDLSDTETGLSYLYNEADELKIVGIIRGNSDAVSTMLSGSIGYTSALTEHMIQQIEQTEIVQKQLADKQNDVILNLPFKVEGEEPTLAQKAEAVKALMSGSDATDRASAYTALMSQPTDEYVNAAVESTMAGLTREYIEKMLTEAYTAQMPTADPESVKKYIAEMDDDTLFGYVRKMLAEQVRKQYSTTMAEQLGAMTVDQLAAMWDNTTFAEAQYASLYDEYVPATASDSSYDENLALLGYVDINSPSSVSIYATTFSDKEKIAAIIDEYNEAADNEADKITYVDYVALLMSSITTIINAISYVLMAFVSISLLVSSIMIGIITYISVLERTKEIGILRAMGASKRDVKRVFNAETMIVGFTSGAIGIGVTVLLCIPINIIIRHLTNIQSLGAALPPVAGLILVAISVILTLVAGLIPSALAAKRDPVIALRTE